LIAEAVHTLLAGASMRSIIKTLDAKGLTISQTGLSKSLRSPTIAGLYDSGDGLLTQGNWPALITHDEWVRVDDILSNPSRHMNTTNSAARWPLAGLVKCSCGGPMRIKPSTSIGPRLACKVCSQSIKYEPIENYVVRELLELLDDATWRRLRLSSNKVSASADRVAADLAEMWQRVLARKIGVDEYTEAKELWEGELRAESAAPVDLPNVDSIRDAWPTLGIAPRKVVLGFFVQSLVVSRPTPGAKTTDLGRVDLDLIG
jgi:hypothetical protein